MLAEVKVLGGKSRFDSQKRVAWSVGAPKRRLLAVRKDGRWVVVGLSQNQQAWRVIYFLNKNAVQMSDHHLLHPNWSL